MASAGEIYNATKAIVDECRNNLETENEGKLRVHAFDQEYGASFMYQLFDHDDQTEMHSQAIVRVKCQNDIKTLPHYLELASQMAILMKPRDGHEAHNTVYGVTKDDLYELSDVYVSHFLNGVDSNKDPKIVAAHHKRPYGARVIIQFFREEVKRENFHAQILLRIKQSTDIAAVQPFLDLVEDLHRHLVEIYMKLELEVSP